MTTYRIHKYYELKSEELLKLSKEMTCSRLKAIRASYKLTQVDFSTVLNISYFTYKNWERGHRHPSTPAVALLILAEKNPTLFMKKQKRYFKKLIK